MATKKVYPFIHALTWDDGGSGDCDDVVFDAREVESYSYSRLEDGLDEAVIVRFKSGKEIAFYLDFHEDPYHGDNLITMIDRVLYSHFWHDNEDSLPDEDEE